MELFSDKSYIILLVLQQIRLVVRIVIKRYCDLNDCLTISGLINNIMI